MPVHYNVDYQPCLFLAAYNLSTSVRFEPYTHDETATLTLI